MENILIGLMALTINAGVFAYYLHTQIQHLQEMMVYQKDNVILEIGLVNEKVYDLTQLVMRLDPDVVEFPLDD